MKKTLVLAGSMLALMATIASAQGINLAWDDCSSNGTTSLSSLCTSNTGVPYTMVASFLPPAGVDRFIGISAQVDVTTNNPALPDWWKHGVSQCRLTSGLTVSFDFTGGPFSCVDVFGGQAAGGFNYSVGFGSPNRARLLVQAAVEPALEGPVVPGIEYYAFKLNVQRARSTGAGSCAGCAEPMCIVLNNIQLFQPLDAAFDPDLSAPAPSNFVTWQSAVVPGCPLSTPTRNSSWGQVKSLYR